MNRTKVFLSMIVSAFLLTGCASTPLPALIFNSSEHHVSGSPITGPTDVKILKSGKSCSNYSILNWLFYSGGEGSIEEAMKDGKITKVAVVDKSAFSILSFIFSRECVLVFGE
ncbi:TRL-like family protein [Leptospira fletcheri]|uniref:TRL-like family protein n=1 Tax=Leptospira fletcheri TaxID=2484981 RepID=A0A4V3JD62_9LEPT|nr:TRL domain-containing protein [Leptospira fletcheri]TGK08759.1 TRL-like family protein [Leptospira fletcheri]